MTETGQKLEGKPDSAIVLPSDRHQMAPTDGKC